MKTTVVNFIDGGSWAFTIQSSMAQEADIGCGAMVKE